MGSNSKGITLVGPPVKAKYNGRFRPARIMMDSGGRPIIVDEGYVRVHMVNHGGMRLAPLGDIESGWKATDTDGIVVIAGGKARVIDELNRLADVAKGTELLAQPTRPQSSRRQPDGSYEVRYAARTFDRTYIVEPLA